MSDAPILVWFRQDLRLSDHPALIAAHERGQPILCVYVLDDDSADDWALGAASRWWLHHSLSRLDKALHQRHGSLCLLRGPAQRCLGRLAGQVGADAVYFQRELEPWASAQEQRVQQELTKQGLEVRRFQGRLLFEPERIHTGSGTPYKVFTPFWKACRSEVEPPAPKPVPSPLRLLDHNQADSLENWGLLPTRPDWAGGLRDEWSPGEQGAHQRLENFIDRALDDYRSGRDRPGREGTSRLSPHLHFGEISPGQVWHRIRNAVAGEGRSEAAAWSFLRELGWREFCHHLLHHFPDLPNSSFKPEFERFDWRDDGDGLRRWQRGLTGFPIVDAGMRELWTTGWMHNRVRMIAGSFLVKDLRVHWLEGERWFWDSLVDADLSNNAAGWQWIAGSGADAAPYFRVFNPLLQSRKFDARGHYIRRWVPELARLPDQHIHSPSDAPAAVLAEAGVELEKDYPRPMVDHDQARKEALAAYQGIRKGD